MNTLREISPRILKAMAVPAAVALGFFTAHILRIPPLLQAALAFTALFHWMRIPDECEVSGWKILGIAAFCCGFAVVAMRALEYLPGPDPIYYLILILNVFPYGPVLYGLERVLFHPPGAPEIRPPGI